MATESHSVEFAGGNHGRRRHICAFFNSADEEHRVLRSFFKMEGFIPPVEAIFEERAKHPVLLVGAVEEGANVTPPAVIASCKLHGMTLGCHISPHIHPRYATESTIANCIPDVYGDNR